MTATPAKTLEQIRAEHKAHTGFVWNCPRCRNDYARALERRAEQLAKQAQPPERG